MPATNLPELLDFEGQFEAAAQGVLAAIGLTSFISQQGAAMPLISTGIAFDITPAEEVFTSLPRPSNWPAGLCAPQEYFRYGATLEFRIEVPRDGNTPTIPEVATLLAQFRGMIRASFMRTVAPFNSTNLPFYEVGNIRPNGAITGWEGVRNIDFCALRFSLTFAIRPDAWPAWIES
jgi:hypothetical protein